MGVPAFFRWLSRKMTAIVVHCVEEKPQNVDGVKIPVDTSKPNPNDYEFDNLYLDMNGIIHPCCHPEDKPPPKNEDEMMVLIFEYIDRIFSIVRPRKLLYMAIDGVAPRAKMNQQRSRRFRASKESAEKSSDLARYRDELLTKGAELPPEKPASEKFDSNCITPGTPFMFYLADCLRYYVHDRLNNDPGWRNIKVILSDANVPGEGEHKIMDYIRRQRASPDHDANTKHCLCGADADLIMLGLATHEPHFTIIREEFKPNAPKACELCGQLGHDLKECQGLPKRREGEHDELNKLPGLEQEFIFIRLYVLREYLERELQMNNLPFPYNFERAIDDWVFMCFFVGNDFLPHLPSLEIREGAIDRLVKLYKSCVHSTGGYLTDSGIVNLERVQVVLSGLGEVEDEIFKKRRQTELDFRRRDKEKKRRNNQYGRPSFMSGGQYAPQKIGAGVNPISNPRQTAYQGRMQQTAQYSTAASDRNQEAAQALKAMLVNGEEGKSDERGTKRKHEDDDNEEENEQDKSDEVRLWEDGWKERYYESKFGVDLDDTKFRYKVANEYVLGLCWVLRYYYQGCASWKWYFPYHYAPFASDFVNIADLKIDFASDTEPFKPLEQLMGVFPAASKKHLPLTWQTLMEYEDSEIIDQYPTDFKIDLNGKKYAWQGVALLPFVDEKRLLKALESVYPDLNQDEKSRNIRSSDRLFVSCKHPAYPLLEALYEGEQIVDPVHIDPSRTGGMSGTVWCDEKAVMRSRVYESPIPHMLKPLPNNQVISVHFRDPEFAKGYLFPARVLPAAKFPEKTLKPEDFQQGRNWRPQIGMSRNSGYRGRGSFDSSTGKRFIRHNIEGQYNSIPPPASLTGQSRWSGQGQARGGRGGWQGNSSRKMDAYQQNERRRYGGYGGDRYGGGSSSSGASYGSSRQSYSTRDGSSQQTSGYRQQNQIGYPAGDYWTSGSSSGGGGGGHGGGHYQSNHWEGGRGGGGGGRGRYPQPPSYYSRR
ncbi:5'-3' exoribonuclease 2-like [Tubulanus polymorphus]|uniref:5'-3' exoribonuclease 2-like n=1 Tax=Tubulanus polymorphus TaxID=672921 RepID=UPI003DA667FE